MTTAACPLCSKLTNLHELPGDELVWQFAHSVAVLGPWQFYQGYCILVARRHATELFHLEHGERHACFDEMCLLAQAIADCFQPLKLNYELLGNQVPHLHWHLFPRYADDPERLRPVWPVLERADHDEQERRRLQTATLTRAEIVTRLRERLTQLTNPKR